MFYDVIQDSRGDIVVVGNTRSTNVPNYHGFGVPDYYVVKYDSNLNRIWSTAFGYSNEDNGMKIIEYKDGYLLGGESISAGGQVVGLHGSLPDMWLARIDTAGNFLYGKCLGGSDIEYFHDFIVDSLDNIIITGGTLSNDGDVYGNHLFQPQVYTSDVWVCRVDSALSVINQICIGGSEYDEGWRIVNNGGTYLVLVETYSNNSDISCPYSNGNCALVTITGNGFYYNYCIGDSGDDIGYDICVINDSAIVILGTSSSSTGTFMNNQYGDFDIFFTQINGGLINKITSYQLNSNGAYIYDGYVYFLNRTQSLRWDLRITDIMGRVAYTNNGISQVENRLLFDLKDLTLSNGIYNLDLNSGNISVKVRYLKNN
jgi:hypothetical protein